MKKKQLHILMVLLFLLVVSAACGGNAEPVAEPETSTGDQPGGEEAPVAEAATLPPPVVEVDTDPGADAPAEEGVVSEEPAPAEEAETPVFPWPVDRFGYGVQSHAVVGDPAQTMHVIDDQLGVQWVKVQMEWPLVHPDPETYQWFFYDGVVDEANKQGLNLMFSIVGAPPWTRASGTENGPPDDYALYADFLREVLNRYPGKVHAIEVWNEQNIDREWATPQGLSPAAYVEFLSQAYQAINEVDPNVIVISGALAPTGVHDQVTSYDDFIYMEGMLEAGLLNYADCVGAHHNGYNIGPDVPWDQTGNDPNAATASFRGPFANPHHSWSFKTTIDTYAEMVQAVDPAKQLCVTEFGWGSSEGHDAYPEGFEFVNDNTLEEQAQFIVQAFQQMHDSDDVWLAFLFNFDFGNKGSGPTDDPVPYSIVDLNGAPRPAFEAVASMEKVP